MSEKRRIHYGSGIYTLAVRSAAESVGAALALWISQLEANLKAATALRSTIRNGRLLPQNESRPFLLRDLENLTDRQFSRRTWQWRLSLLEF